MYVDDAVQLLRELRRAADGTLPPYNEERVRAVIRECISLYSRGHSLHASGQGDRALLVTLTLCLKRNKRCLVTYLKHRADRVRALCWAAGGAFPSAPEVKSNMSRAEIELARNYVRVLGEYRAAYFEIDLTANPMPPKELFIQVRALQDCGVIQTEGGSINMAKNSQHYVRRSDVEHLIGQGFLLHIK